MEDTVMTEMEKNIGRICSFDLEDGSTMFATVDSVSNSEHYRVCVPRNGYDWEWYVRSESVRFAL
jgi:hypothetical protein